MTRQTLCLWPPIRNHYGMRVPLAPDGGLQAGHSRLDQRR
jgi:hypothetical protein